MATYTKTLTCHATAAAGTVDTINLTGVDVAKPAGGAANAPYATPKATVNVGPLNGAVLFNASTTDLWWTHAVNGATATTPTVPADGNAADGVRRLPAGASVEMDFSGLGVESVQVKVLSAAGGAYSVEVWQ